jgi:hypothetical protein
LIDELDFNERISEHRSADVQGCLFQDEQLRRAIREGAISMLRDDIKTVVLEAYVAMGRVNQQIAGAMTHPTGSNAWAESANAVSKSIGSANPVITAARELLLKFLGSE